MSKTVALIFALLMMGGTIGMFVGAFIKPSDEVEIPQNRIIKYKLTEAQIKELLRNYNTVVEYEYSSGCMECGILLTSLEEWTMRSDDQIYLQEIQSDTSSPGKLTIISLRGQKTLYDPSYDDVRNIICDLLISRSLFCLEISIPESQDVTNSIDDTNTTANITI